VRQYHTPVLEQRTLGTSLIGGPAGLQCTDVIERTIALGEVEAVADDELVGNLETYVSTDKIDASPGRLGEQRADLQRGRSARLQVLRQVTQGQA
jgi:hypothetical protein